MSRWAGRVAIVTGASSGIGEALCKKLVEDGMIVIGAARRKERIDAFAGALKNKRGKLIGFKCDLTKDSDVEALFSFAKKNYKGVDVLVNNAGFSHKHSLLEGTTKEWREMMDVNVISLCLGSKLAIKSMQERKVDDGHIIHVSSMAGHLVPNMPIGHFYCSTKQAVRTLTECLRQELSSMKSNIRISSISPAGVDTEFIANVLGEDGRKEILKTLPVLKAEDVAENIRHILNAPPQVQIHDMLIRPTCDVPVM